VSISQDLKGDLSFYTNLNIGDTKPVIDNDYHKIRFYAFINGLSCFTCIKTLINLSNYVNTFDNCEIVLFLQSENYDLSKENLIKENWRYKIINDQIGAYKKLYEIKNSPVCLLLNDTGLVKFIGIPGSSSHFDIDNFKKTIFELSNNSSNERKSSIVLPKLKEIKLKSKNINFSKIGKILQGYWEKKKGYFLFYGFQSKKLIVFDSTGMYVKQKDFSNFLHPFFTFSSKYKDKYIFTDFDSKYNLSFYFYDLASKSIKKFYTVHPKNGHYPLYTYLFLNDSILVSSYWLDNKFIAKRESNNYSFSIYNILSNESKEAGVFDRYYLKYHLRNYFHLDFCSNNKNQIVMIQNFTDSLRVYDISGKFVNSLYINYDKKYYYYNWKKSFGKLNKKSSLEDIKMLADSVTNLCASQCLLYDNTINRYYIIYQKYFKSITNDKEYRYFIHTIPNNNQDYYLGRNKPFYVDDGNIYCFKQGKDFISINIFKLK